MLKSLRVLWRKMRIRKLATENVFNLSMVKFTPKYEIAKVFPKGKEHCNFFPSHIIGMLK